MDIPQMVSPCFQAGPVLMDEQLVEPHVGREYRVLMPVRIDGLRQEFQMMDRLQIFDVVQ